MNTHIISIHEYASGDTAGSRSCRVRISIDGFPKRGIRLIQDPFHVNDKDLRHGHLAYYLEDGLGDDIFNQRRADDYTIDIHEYRIRLFESLQLHEDVQGFKYPNILINVFAYPEWHERPNSKSHMSILEYYWELLELIPHIDDNHMHNVSQGDKRRRRLERKNLWPSGVKRVSVRRVIPARSFSNRILVDKTVPRTVSWSHLVGNDVQSGCRVLLVIARKLARPSEYEISPSFIECSLLRLFETLNREIGREFYQLEVVRPGSFTELEDHLRLNGPFHMVHFDMHGIVLCQKEGCGLPRNKWRPIEKEKSCRIQGDGHMGRAFLIFAGLDGDRHLITSAHSAADIGRLLHQYKVPCVALNACESARTNEGTEGNLSYTFLQQGISNVVAMSFRISDYMFVKYYSSFYKALFAGPGATAISEAASRARLDLQHDRERRDAFNDPIDIDDWFVPVFYCKEDILTLSLPESTATLVTDNSLAHDEHRRSARAYRNVMLMKATASVLVLSYWVGILFWNRDAYSSLAISVVLLSVTTALLVYALNLSRAALNLRYVASPAATEIQSAVLDNNMLNIESELKNHKPLVLHGLSNIPDTLSLIDNLAFVWGRTKFVDLVVVIPAAWFYQPEPVQLVRRWCCRLAHHAHCCRGEKSECHANLPERTIFIVTDLEMIFPQQPETQLNRLQRAMLPDAQQRLVRFFERRFKDKVESDKMKSDKAQPLVLTAGGDKPYLFLSGSPTLEDPETLTASLDRLNVLGIRSIVFAENGEYRNRTAHIEGHIGRK